MRHAWHVPGAEPSAARTSGQDDHRLCEGGDEDPDRSPGWGDHGESSAARAARTAAWPAARRPWSRSTSVVSVTMATAIVERIAKAPSGSPSAGRDGIPPPDTDRTRALLLKATRRPRRISTAQPHPGKPVLPHLQAPHPPATPCGATANGASRAGRRARTLTMSLPFAAERRRTTLSASISERAYDLFKPFSASAEIEARRRVPTIIAHHDVKDKATGWPRRSARSSSAPSASPTSARSSTRPNPTQVAVLMDVPDMDAVMAAMQTSGRAEAMEYDGVLPETGDARRGVDRRSGQARPPIGSGGALDDPSQSS